MCLVTMKPTSDTQFVDPIPEMNLQQSEIFEQFPSESSSSTEEPASCLPQHDRHSEIVPTPSQPLQDLESKRVRFHPIVREHISYCYQHDHHKEQDVANAWYFTDELRNMKRQVQELVLQSWSTNKVDTDSMRGLESCSMERVEYRYQIRQTILQLAATNHNNPENYYETMVAHIATHLTAWNAHQAFLQACHDYAHIYDTPQLVGQLPSISQVPPPTPFFDVATILGTMTTKKRPFLDATTSTYTNSTMDRRIRRRLA